MKCNHAWLCLLLFPLISCSGISDIIKDSKRTSIAVQVENRTGGRLTDVNVYVVQAIQTGRISNYIRTDSARLGSLEAGQRGAGTLHEKNIRAVDGDFELSAVDAVGKTYKKRFGYLTNGSFLADNHSLIIQKDTILVR